jgi:superoxide dismutase
LFEELSSTIKTTFQDPKNAAIYHHVRHSYFLLPPTQASELWNHMFFFKGMTPGGKKMSSDLEQLIVQNFGGLEQLKEQVALLV